MASTEAAPIVQAQSQARKLAGLRQLQGYRPIPIDASVILLFLSDVEGGDSSPCVQMVNRAMEFKGRAINFFVTAYYADDNGNSRATRIGWKKSMWDKSFRPMDMSYVSKYKAGLAVSSSVPALPGVHGVCTLAHAQLGACVCEASSVCARPFAVGAAVNP
jgi:hypothetical protein